MFVNARARVYRVPDVKLNKKAKTSEKTSSPEVQGQALHASPFTVATAARSKCQFKANVASSALRRDACNVREEHTVKPG